MAEETKKPETKKEENQNRGSAPPERTGKEFTIPLRRKFKKTASYRRAPKAIRAIKEFLVRHMKMYDRDLKKVKLDKYLNEFVWTRGIKNPPSKIKIRAVIDGDFIRAELSELTEKLRFKKGKLEKREKAAEAIPKKVGPEVSAEAPEKTETEKAEEKEKKAAVVEAGQKMERAAEKQAKHQTKISKQPKRQRRMALEK